MNIGVPKERRPSEFRVGLSPQGVQLLTKEGHSCYIECGAGIGAGFSDENYSSAGAQIVYTGEEVFGRADLVLKVARPIDEEIEWLVPEQTLAGYLFLPVAHPKKIKSILEKHITTVAYEQIQRSDGTLPVLKPLSQIGGRMAAQIAANLLQNNSGGRGVFLGGVPGVPPAEVVIIGAGIVGTNAAKAFLGLGAHVTILDKDLDRLQQLSETLSGQFVTMVSHSFNIERVCAFADVVVGAVMIPGERAPIVITKKIVQRMRPGSLLLDLSIDEGGCSETSRPTSHDNPTYLEEGVMHCCIPNIPGVVARTSTHAFLNAAWPYIQKIVNLGIEIAFSNDPSLESGIATYRGEIRNLKHFAFINHTGVGE